MDMGNCSEVSLNHSDQRLEARDCSGRSVIITLLPFSGERLGAEVGTGDSKLMAGLTSVL